MPAITGYKQVSLKELVNTFNRIGESGELKAAAILSTFSCPLNPDVEDFIRSKAIEFSKQGIAATHLVFASYQDQVVLVGYYALANKPVCIKGSELNSNWRSKMSRFAKYDVDSKRYYIALPLIGQLGKNFCNDYNKLITGAELLQMALDKIRETQYIMGGKITYLECEDKPKLIDFYKANGFIPFANRNITRGELGLSDSQYLVQMLRYFPDK